MTGFSNLRRRAAALAVVSLACTPPHTSTPPAPLAASAAPPHSISLSTPLTRDQQRWVDSTLASLSLHDRVGQMVNVWVMGDYTSVGDSSFAEVLRWIEHDHVGGVTMSLGTPSRWRPR